MESDGIINVEELDKSQKVYQLKKSVVVEYSKWLYKNDYAIKTSSEYCRHIRKLIGKSHKISIDRIKEYLGMKNNKNTISYAAVRMFVNFLDDKYNVNFPYFKYPRFKKEQKIKPQAPTKEEVKLVIEEFRKDKESRYRDFDYTLFIETSFRLGNRISELVKANVANIDWNSWLDNRDWGKIAFTKTKGKKSRIANIPDDLMEKIFLYVSEVEDKIYSKKDLLFDFGFEPYRKKKFKKYKLKGIAIAQGDDRSEDIVLLQYIKKCSNDIERRLKELSKKAIGREITTHSLRSAKATDLDKQDVSLSKIRDILGHANISTTSGYIRNRPEDIESELREKDKF